MEEQIYVSLSNLFLKESKVLLTNREEAEKGGCLTLSVSAENIVNQNEIFSLDLVCKVQAKNETTELKLFDIFCIFSSSFTVNNSSANLSKEDEAKIATICFSQAYLSIREYIADTLRRMSVLAPVNSLPFVMDFENENIAINSDCDDLK